MRVGFLIDRWQPTRGGAERALAQLAGFLEERGHEVLAFGLEGPRAEEDAPGTFRPVHAHGLTRGARERDLAERLLAAAAGADCDVTLGVRHLPRVDVLWPHGGTHAATLRALGKWPLGRHRTFLALEREAFTAGARRIVCVSPQVEREALDLYPASASRLRVVPNGVDLERFHPRERARSRDVLAGLFAAAPAAGEPLLTFVGRNPRLKGLPRVLDALARLRSRPWRLVVAGPPDAERWRRRARRLGLADRVVVRPQLDPVELAAGGDLLVLPSRREPCGLVVLEALAAGTPVLVSDAVGAREGLEPAGGETVSARGGAAELARALERRMGQAAPERDVLREAVATRDHLSWLSAMESELLQARV